MVSGSAASCQASPRQRAFTLIELLVVMAIIATLLAIAAPRYFDSVDRAKEAALRTDLRVLREAIDKHRADTGQYPASIQRLVDLKYVRNVPADPVTDSATTWTLVPHPDGITPGVYDVRSGSPALSRDGTPYASW